MSESCVGIRVCVRVVCRDQSVCQSVCRDQSVLVGCFRLAQLSWLVQTTHLDQLVYFVNEQSLSVMTFNLTQDEFVGKVHT